MRQNTAPGILQTMTSSYFGRGASSKVTSRGKNAINHSFSALMACRRHFTEQQNKLATPSEEREAPRIFQQFGIAKHKQRNVENN